MDIDIFNVAAKPIPSQVPAFTEAGGQATWPPSTATLISGETESLLVDALMTTAEGRELAAWVSQHQRALSAVYITHPHADHLFGLGPVLREHPDARPVTLSGMVPAMREQAGDAWVQVWEGFFPGQIEAPGTLPEPVDGDSLTIDGAPTRFVATGQTDTELSSVVYVPDNATVVAGDVAYNGVHMWMYQSTPESRSSWLRVLDIVESLGPSTVIAGHRDPGVRDDDAHRVLDESRTYIHDFEAALGSSTSPQDLIDIMMSKHGAPRQPLHPLAGRVRSVRGPELVDRGHLPHLGKRRNDRHLRPFPRLRGSADSMRLGRSHAEGTDLEATNQQGAAGVVR